MTSALVGCGTFVLEVDDATGATFGLVDVEVDVEVMVGVVPAAVGADDGPGSAAAAADEIVGTGPGFAGCAEEQPETTASAAPAAQSIPRTCRSRGRRDAITLFTIFFIGRALEPLCHRDMTGPDGRSAEVWQRGESANAGSFRHARPVEPVGTGQ